MFLFNIKVQFSLKVTRINIGLLGIFPLVNDTFIYKWELKHVLLTNPPLKTNLT